MLGAAADVPAKIKKEKLPPETTQLPPAAARQAKYPSCDEEEKDISGV